MVVGIEAAHANKIERTGVEEYCWQVIQELKKTIPATERVVLYTNEPLRDGLAVLPPHWEVKVLRWPFKKLWSQTRLALELFLHPPDVFFAPGQLLPLYVPKKTITTVHDVAFRVFPSAYTFFGRWYLRLMQRWIGWFSARILVPSQFTKNEIRRLYPRVDEKKIQVIPLSFDRGVYTISAADPAVLKKYGVIQPYIITIGRLEEKKNTRRLIEAFTALRQERALQLVLVGKPRVGYAEIQAVIGRSPFAEDIHELGYIPTQDAVELLRQAQVFVFPSLYEGFGIPVLEAMAVGTPVVTSSAGALEEVVGSAALYCNPLVISSITKAVAELLNDPRMYDMIRQRGLEHVQKYAWERTAEQVWRCIVSLK